MGAGLGGGSANASAVLKMLNQLFALQLNASQLRAHSATLGSDCPFFITPSPMLATGRGEHLSPINLTLSGYYLVIIKPSASVSTAEAYRKIRPQRPDTPFIRILSQPIHAWKNLLRNDFEDVLFSSLPDVEDIKSKLYRSGALYAAMSGSGSAVYGLFANHVELDADFAGLQRWSGILP